MPPTFKRPLGPLKHNPRNQVTAGIERIEWRGSTCVRKTLSKRNAADAQPQWLASETVDQWNYWARERDVYRSSLSTVLNGTGVRLPKVLDEEATADGCALYLEDVDGRTGHELQLEDYLQVAQAWGRGQARLMSSKLADAPWLSRDFIRAYARSKNAPYQALYDDGCWRAPLIEENWDTRVRRALIYLHEHSEVLFAIVQASQRALCHLDLWPNNVFLDANDTLIPVDWSFFGLGALGEDIGNFIPDAVFDGFMPPERLSELDATLFDGYVAGLREGGVDVHEKELRRNVQASAVKYVWLGPLLLARAQSDQQFAYGDESLADANEQYRVRGETLVYLGEWARLALSH